MGLIRLIGLIGLIRHADNIIRVRIASKLSLADFLLALLALLDLLALLALLDLLALLAL